MNWWPSLGCMSSSYELPPTPIHGKREKETWRGMECMLGKDGREENVRGEEGERERERQRKRCS